MSTANFNLNNLIDNYVFVSNADCYVDKDADEDEVLHLFGSVYNRIQSGKIKNIKRLDIFKLEIRSGYYDGFIIKLALQGLDNLKADWILSDTFTNKNSNYYFGECKSIVQRKAKAEINRINKKILPFIATETDFKKINKVGQFSNGEVIYEYAN